MLSWVSVLIFKDMDEKQTKVLVRLQARCVRREHCVSEVTKKAAEALDGDREAAAAVVASLVADKFVDDRRYAAAFAREKASLSGWGPVKIRYALSAKGLAREVIDGALEEIDGASAERKMEAVLRAKYRTLADDPGCRLKLLKFGLGRGYGYEDIRSLADRIIREEQTSADGPDEA